MSLLLEIGLKSVALMLAALLGAGILRSASASVRHRVWALGFVGLAALPLLALRMPEISVASPRLSGAVVRSDTESSNLLPSPKPQFSVPTASVSAPSASHPAPIDEPPRGREQSFWPSIVIAVWAVVAAASLLSLALQLLSFRRRVRRSDALEVAPPHAMPGIRVVRTSAVDVPATLGVLRPTILLPLASQDWPEARTRAVLLHEGAHIERKDWAWLLFARIVGALYWPNPLVALAARQMRAEAERAADDAVIRAGVPASEYATTLVDLAEGLRRRSSAPALAFVDPGSLKPRVAALLRKVRRQPVGRLAAAAILLAAAVTVVPFAALRFAAAPKAVRDGVIDLGGGGRIEVVAITSMDGGTARSWDVRGALLPQPCPVDQSSLEWFREAQPAVSEGSTVRYVFFRITQFDDGSLPSLAERPGGDPLPARSVISGLWGGYRYDDPQGGFYYVVRVVLPKGTDDLSLYTRVPTGSWRLDESIDYRNGRVIGRSSPGAMRMSVSDGAIRDVAFVMVSFSLPQASKERQVELRTLPPSANYRFDGKTGDLHESFGVPFRDLRKVELRSRSSQQVMLDRLPMEPVQGTVHVPVRSGLPGLIEARDGKATLPDGSLLSVEGVWNGNAGRKSGWTAKGDFLSSVNPYPDAPAKPIEGMRPVRLSIGRNSSEFVAMDAYDGEGYLTPIRISGQGIDTKSEHVGILMQTGKERRAMDLLVRLAPGKPHTIAEGMIGQSGYRGFNRYDLVPQGQLCVEFPRAVLPRIANVFCTMRLVDANGEEVTNDQGNLSYSRSNAGEDANQVTFDLKPDRARRVRRLIIEARPYVWVRFSDVALVSKSGR